MAETRVASACGACCTGVPRGGWDRSDAQFSSAVAGVCGWDRVAQQLKGQGGVSAESGFPLSLQCWSSCFPIDHLPEMLRLRVACFEIGWLAPWHAV